MSAPTTEEMLMHLNDYDDRGNAYASKCPICQAICSLILAVGEWKNRAAAMICSEPPEYDGSVSVFDFVDFAKDIRDFGEGK